MNREKLIILATITLFLVSCTNPNIRLLDVNKTSIYFQCAYTHTGTDDTITLTNVGPEVYHIVSNNVDDNYWTSTDVDTNLAENDSVDIQVTFHPTANGTFTTTLEISIDGDIMEIPLAGVGNDNLADCS